jgi:two-component system, OmpR family, response regulator
MGDIRRVLLVDDEEDIRTFAIFSLIAQGGFAVEEAASGSEALLRVRNLEFDVILMDFNMPEMNGVETVRRMREAGIQTPVVFFTANTHPIDLARYDGAGALGVIAKPFDPLTLADRVEQVIGEAVSAAPILA